MRIMSPNYRVISSRVLAVLASYAIACACDAQAAETSAQELLREPAAWHPRETTSDVFTFADGVLSAQRRSYQSATIVTTADYENFQLEFEFNVKRWCELLLLLHAPWNGADEAGLQLVLSDHHDNNPSIWNAGALLGKVAPPVMAMKPDDEWNTCRVEFDWPRLKISLNGVALHDLDLSAHADLRHTLRRGKIGFRDLLGWGFEVRNMQLTKLPDSENAIELYNGRDLSGWKEVRSSSAKWEANGETLTGRDGNGYLQHERAVQDFALQLYYRASPTANGGVFFRWMTDDSDRGNEIQILDVPESTMPSGSIYGLSRADPAGLRPVGEWQLLQLFVEGAHAVTYLNGKKCAETSALEKIRPGHITLQMHKENSRIEFRDIALVPLPTPLP